MEVFVPLVVKPALVNPYVPSQWTLGDHWSHCPASALFVSPDLAVKAATSTTAKTMRTCPQLIRRSIAFEKRMFSISLLEFCSWPWFTHLIRLMKSHFYNWQVQYNSTPIVRHAKWESIPKNTYLNPSVHHWNAKMCTSKYTVHFFLLHISEISCQNSWVLPLISLECVYFYSKCQESCNILIKKNWQL